MGSSGEVAGCNQLKSPSPEPVFGLPVICYCKNLVVQARLPSVYIAIHSFC